MSSDDISYLRGQFIAYDPGGYPSGAKRVIPFRFNPEQLSRSLQVEQGQAGAGTEGATAGGRGGSGGGGEQAADASSGRLKQGFSVQVRFDFADRNESARGLPPELGIAPELAALESLLYPAESASAKSSDGKEPVRARAQRPTLLFIWGRKRVLPVRITAMTINETMYNAQLNPVRAEVDISLELLGDTDAKDNKAVQDALSFTDTKRRELAQMFLDTTASQGTNILDL